MKRYWPLFVLILIAALEAYAVSYGMQKDMHFWMHLFMGLFLCKFALLKLFNPKGFAEGFLKYDYVAKKFSMYAYIYPLIELGLGLCYLSFVVPVLIYILTIVVMGVGAFGVIRALKQGLDLRCACMGTVLDVPLSTVTLAEDIGMVGMALWMLFASH